MASFLNSLYERSGEIFGITAAALFFVLIGVGLSAPASQATPQTLAAAVAGATPSLSLSASTPAVGFPALLIWTTQNANNCQVTAPDGTVVGQGISGAALSEPITITSGKQQQQQQQHQQQPKGKGETYTLACTSPAGAAVTQAVSVSAVDFTTAESPITVKTTYNYTFGDVGACAELGYTTNWNGNPRIGGFALYNPDDTSQITWADLYANQSVITGGTAPALTPGSQVEVAWQCLQKVSIAYLRGYTSTILGEPGCALDHYGSQNYANTFVASGALEQTQATASSGLFSGRATVTMPQSGTLTQSFTCGNYQLVTLRIGPEIAPPTLTIAAVPAAVLPGKKSVITATYAPASGDTLVSTAVNDGNSNSVGVPWGAPYSPKTYNFSTTTPGVYTFYPAAQTANHPAWNNYSQSATVTVCSANAKVSGNACVCNSGFAAQGALCVPSCPANASPNAQGSGCACDAGYTMKSGACVSNCPAGQVVVNGACVAISNLAALPNINSFTAGRVRIGEQSTLSWSISGMSAGISCAISPIPSSGTQSGAITWNNANLWTGSALTPAISGTKIYTLTCTNGKSSVSASASAELLPNYKEI